MSVNHPTRREPPNTHSDGERPCPICGQAMAQEREMGVTIDVCEEHGIWLDKGELNSIKSRIGARALRMARQRERAARRQGKLSGIFWGWLSLLGD